MHTAARALLVALACSPLAAQADAPTKKLIEYGWDVPNPTFVRDNIRAMEKRPFDGLIFRMDVGGRVFVPEKWAPDSYEPDLRVLGEIDWDRFTDNFIAMYAASEIDWFDDAQWEAAVHNTRITARAAKIAGCRGVCFDAEPYGKNPWLYSEQPGADRRSFAAFEAQYRRRGAQFIEAVQAEMPDAVVHTFFLFTFMQGFWDREPGPELDADLATHPYGLYRAFIEGMLEAAGPGITITDGNEGSYYYTNTDAFFAARAGIKRDAVSMVAPEFAAAYREHVQVSQALYVDHLFNLRTQKYLSANMTPEEHARWFEHNVYYALRTSEEFVWLYSERMNWWKDDVPEGLEAAVDSAREKVRDREPLGYDLAPIIERAQARERAELRSSLVTRSTDVARLAVAPPTIDGDLSDEAWGTVAPLEPFVACLRAKAETPPAATEARVATTDQALYISLRCTEPNTASMEIVGDSRDSSIWMGDSVDIFLAPPGREGTYYHFIVSPRNVVWDAEVGEDEDLGYNPTWQHNARVAEGEWVVEASIPWAALGTEAPRSGSTWGANLCRQRPAGTGELSSWSQCVGGFVEPENLGTWVLR